MELSPETLKKRVEGYIERAKKEDGLQLYPLEEVEVFRVVGGTDSSGSCSGLGLGGRYGIKHDLVRGRFIDAIVYAVQQSDFYGWYCSSDNMDNPHHGFVVKADIQKLKKVKGLDELI